MNSGVKLNNNHYSVILSILYYSIIILYVAPREKWASAGKDVVVLHTVPRGNYCPSLSPFALKLETFLRMMDIKYQVSIENIKYIKSHYVVQ